MFLVVWTTKIRDDDYPDCHWSHEDHWTSHETYEDAEKWFHELLKMDELYSATIAQPVKSTDYQALGDWGEDRSYGS